MSFGGVSLALLATVVALVGSCFVAGLFAETALIRHLVDRAERLALAVPGYSLMKNVGANLIGIEGKHPVRTVLVRCEATSQLGFLMETLLDGRHVVFIPGVPRARRHAAHRTGRPGADSRHVRHRGARRSRSAGRRTSGVVAEGRGRRVNLWLRAVDDCSRSRLLQPRGGFCIANRSGAAGGGGPPEFCSGPTAWGTAIMSPAKCRRACGPEPPAITKLQNKLQQLGAMSS